MTGSKGPVSHSDRSPGGLVSTWPLSMRTCPPPPISPTRLGRSGSKAMVWMPSYPRRFISCCARSATLRSSPGGAGLGIATSSRANSMSSRSRAARAFRTCCSRAECAGLDGGVRLLVRGSAGVFDPVAAGPPHSLPGFQLGGFDLEEPARLFHGRLQVGRAVLAEVAVAHAGCDRNPFAADVGALHQLGLAAAQHLAEVLRLLDDKVDARIVGEVLGPARVPAWHDPEVAVSPFMPADGDVRVAARRHARQLHVDPASQQ